MKIAIFSVYDSKTKIFGQPNFLINKGAAIRAWSEAANDKQSNIGKHPADYTMFYIADWDDETGTITMRDVKENLGTAIEYIRTEDSFDKINKHIQLQGEA